MPLTSCSCLYALAAAETRADAVALLAEKTAAMEAHKTGTNRWQALLLSLFLGRPQLRPGRWCWRLHVLDGGKQTHTATLPRTTLQAALVLNRHSRISERKGRFDARRVRHCLA